MAANQNTLGVRRPLEKDILREMCEWLETQGYFFWRANNIPVFGMSNDGQKRFRSMPKYSMKGVPDIIVITSGNFVGIEVKVPGRKLRPEQEDFRTGCIFNGGVYIQSSSLDDLQRKMGVL